MEWAEDPQTHYILYTYVEANIGKFLFCTLTKYNQSSIHFNGFLHQNRIKKKKTLKKNEKFSQFIFVLKAAYGDLCNIVDTLTHISWTLVSLLLP